MNLLSFAKQWKLVTSLWAPILLTTIPYYWEGHTGKEPYAAYVIALMAVYWMTECIPLAVTSFLPVLLFPIFGILSSDAVASVYLKDSILFLMSGVIIALAVEYSNLHTRIAIKVILLVGAQIPRLLLGIMITTMFLSMWMNNTSTTAMMVPIVTAILQQLRNEMILHSNNSDLKANNDTTSVSHGAEKASETAEMCTFRKDEIRSASNNVDLNTDGKSEVQNNLGEQLNTRIKNLRTMFLLAVAYSSNIGGTGIITGSATNIVALDLVRKDADQSFCPEACKKLLNISFLDWMIFNFPSMILNTIVCWIYLQIHFVGIPQGWKFWQSIQKRRTSDEITKMDNIVGESVSKALRLKYNELGPISLHEIGVAATFATTVALWIFKDPQFMPGWDALPIFQKTATGKSFIKECTPTLLMCVVLFLVPKERIYFKTFFSGGFKQGMSDTLLTWKFVNDKFPWGVFILLGGGSAMATGARESGLNKWMEEVLESNGTLQTFPAPALFLLMLCIITFLTTIASNIACAAIITPVLLGLSYVKDLHPLYMVLASATVCSYAFMLPVSTPPNAIVYSSSPDMKMADMVKAGVVLNILCIMVLFSTTHTFANWTFHFDDYQNECSNMTILAAGSYLYQYNMKYFRLLPFLILLVYIPLPFFWRSYSVKASETREPVAAYMILVMGTFWLTKCIPVEVTSLLPVVMAPALGIIGSGMKWQMAFKHYESEVVAAYFDESIIFFIGCSIFSCAIEYSDLHTRIALKILLHQKPNLSNLLFGQMFATTFISMFVPNSSCASMMIPITVCILEDLELGNGFNDSSWQSYPGSFITLFSGRSHLEDTDSSVLQLRRSEIEKNTSFPEEIIKNIYDQEASVKRGDKRSAASEKELNESNTGKIYHSGMILNSDKESFNPTASVAEKYMRLVSMNESFKSGSKGDSYFDTEYNHSARYKIRSMFLLATAFSVHVGGTAMLTGCAANIVALYTINDFKLQVENGVSSVVDATKCLESITLNAFTWFKFNMIATWLNFICGFVFFRTYFLTNPCGSLTNNNYDHFESKRLVYVKNSMEKLYQTCGRMNVHQYCVVTLVCIWVLCLLLENINGHRWWSFLNKQNFFKASTTTVFIAILLFFIPRKSANSQKQRKSETKTNGDTLVSWEFVKTKLSWKHVFLLGGGNAIMLCSKTSGLWSTITNTFDRHQISLPLLAILFLLILIALLLTSVVSSTVASIFIAPMALKLAVASGAHPLYFVLHAVTVCSYAFLLTTGTAINTTFAKLGNIKQVDILKCGFCLLLICVTVLLSVTHTFSELMLHFRKYKSFCDKPEL